MASDDRFYLMEMRNRPVMKGDIGSLVRIEGVVVGGGGAQQVMMLPGYMLSERYANVPHVSVEDWSDWLQRSDNPEILVGPVVNGTAPLPKVFHRKLRFEISGAVQQKVWAADGFRCMYCGSPMGKSLMTIDHFLPLELGGKNDVTNYLSACKRCNKDKGSQDPVEWCRLRHYNAEDLANHLKARII